MTPSEFAAFRAWQARPVTGADFVDVFAALGAELLALDRPMPILALFGVPVVMPTYREDLERREAAMLSIRRREVEAFRAHQRTQQRQPARQAV